MRTAAVILGICLVVCAAILAFTWRGNIHAAQTLKVTGSAQMDLVSDLGRLTCTLHAQAPVAEDAFAQLETQLPIVRRYLEQRGVPDTAIETFPVNSWRVEQFDENGRPTGKILAYNYDQRLRIEIDDVHLVKDLSLELAGLVKEGVQIQVQQPEFLYTKLADVKIEVQALAAADAHARAREIAAASGAKLGPITEARMGVLQITPRHSTMVSDYGINDNSSIDKQITAVVHARFAIE